MRGTESSICRQETVPSHISPPFIETNFSDFSAMSYKRLKGFLLTWNGRVCDYLHAFSKRHLPEMRLSGVTARRDWLHSLGSL